MQSPTRACSTLELAVTNFSPLIDQNIYSAIFNLEGKLQVCTTKTAQSLGFNSHAECKGLSYHFEGEQSYALLKEIFKVNDPEVIEQLLNYCQIISKLQQYTIEHKQTTSYIDLLPYNQLFETYFVIYIPLFHNNGEVIGLQSFGVHSTIFGFQNYLAKSLNNSLLHEEIRQRQTAFSLTKREHEILFLIAHGMTQDQIAQILHITRSTVASAIFTQLCPKFNIAGSNTKLLCKAAIEFEFHRQMPPSLWRPAVIITDQKLLNALSISDKEPIQDLLPNR